MSIDVGYCSRESQCRADVESVVRAHAKDLLPVEGLDPFCFLMAIAGAESSFGTDVKARYEPAYGLNGYYFKRSQPLFEMYSKFGALAACSYGPWQILAITASELGFKGHPLELWSAETSIVYTIRFFNQWINQDAHTVEDLADSWNSGSYKDANKPLAYMEKVKGFYDQLKSGKSGLQLK